MTAIIRREPLISENRRPALRQVIERLLQKMQETQHHSFSLFKVRLACSCLCFGCSPRWHACVHVQVLRAHVLPLTNCAFNKSGDRFITGSYDRTCKVLEAPITRAAMSVLIRSMNCCRRCGIRSPERTSSPSRDTRTS